MATPIELEQIRQEELAQAEKQSAQASQKTVEANLIQNATPEDGKAKGIAKLPSLLFTLSSQIPQIIQPSLQGLIQKYIPDPNLCPSDSTLNELISQRNNIAQSLNNIGVKINQLGNSVTGSSSFLNTILGIITSIDLASIIASAAAKLIPVIPGAVPAALNDAQTFIRKTTFDQLGNSKLSKIQGVLGSSSLVISITGTYILNVKNLLTIIDNYISQCRLNANIIPLSDTINAIAESQRQAQQTANQVGYKGFIIEIEEVPYTPTVNRRRAIGKNFDGIVMIQTELSFTTNTQTLINELKFIIDRDNLSTPIAPNFPPVINSISTQNTTQNTTENTTPPPTLNPDPLGYLGQQIGERGSIYFGNGQAEDIYEWNGEQWNYIETITL